MICFEVDVHMKSNGIEYNSEVNVRRPVLKQAVKDAVSIIRNPDLVSYVHIYLMGIPLDVQKIYVLNCRYFGREAFKKLLEELK